MKASKRIWCPECHRAMVPVYANLTVWRCLGCKKFFRANVTPRPAPEPTPAPAAP